MKICFIVPWITQARGGTENVGQMMANAMAARGHAVEILTFDDSRGPARFALSDGIGLHYIDETPGIGQDSQLLLALASIAPDLVVGLHMNRTFLTYVRAARKLGLPLVLSEHQDPRFPARIGMFDPDERQVAFQGATRLHLLNDAFAETLPAHLRDRVRVIPNTVPAAVRQADPVGQGRKPRILLAVARLVARKNLSRLLREFASIAPAHPDWVLRIVGGGPLRAPLEALRADLGLEDRVALPGETEDVYAELAQAQCFVLPSLFEGFPLSGLEAMAHGLPMVGFAACHGVNQQIEPGVSGLLADHAPGPDGLAEALDRLMGDAALRRRMGEAARTRFETRYANDVVFAQWEALFAEAAAEPPPPEISLEARLQADLDRAVYGVRH